MRPMDVAGRAGPRTSVSGSEGADGSVRPPRKRSKNDPFPGWFRNVLTVCPGRVTQRPWRPLPGMLRVSDPSRRERAMPFRPEHIRVTKRVEPGCPCRLFGGRSGPVTGLAREYGTSRQFFYALRERTRTAL